MKKPLIWLLVGVLLGAAFLFYRWKTFGKGNRNLSYPTLFGWPPYDLKAAEKDGLALVNGSLQQA